MAIQLISPTQKTENLQPREKIEQYGIENLNDVELLSTILGTGYGGLNVRELARHLLSEFGIKGLFQFRTLADIQENTGLPLVKSCHLLAIGEYLSRLQRKDDVKLKSSEQFYEYIKDDFKKSTFEQLRIVCTDSQRRVLYSGLIAQGTPNAITVTLASVLYHPIRLNANHFYLAHNHPRGDKKPSKQDVDFTLKIKEAAKQFGLSFADHIIVNKKRFYSFSLKGML